MTDLQKTELAILKEFIRICDSLHLTYYLVCGTALGAAKYGGFIPWDDDVDVALPREDYNVFCAKVQEMLPEHLFLQNYRTDVRYPLPFSKIRDSRTTYIEKSVANIHMHHGVYIDVFPLDGYPSDPKSQEKLEKEKRRYHMSRLCCLTFQKNWKTALLTGIQRLLGMHKHPARFVNRFEKHAARYPTAMSAIWCNHGNWQGKREYASKDQYGEGAFATFEGLHVRIPQNIDAYLTQKYGDWRADLPEKEKKGHHYYEVMSLDTPYTEYLKNKFGK